MSETKGEVKETKGDDITEIFKFKRLLKGLKNIEGGSNTSMISLLIPFDGQIAKTNQMLTVELGTASNIKSRLNRQSVETAISSAQTKLKLYSKLPKNGLAIFTGIGMINGQEKTISVDFEPLYSLKHSLYKCDSIFHTENLEEQLQFSSETVGYIIISGHSCLFGAVTRDSQTVLYEKQVSLPKKHGRGGQSSVRFARLTEAARKQYSTLMAEEAKKRWMTGSAVNIQKLIVGGSTSLKTALLEKIDVNLKKILVAEIDLAQGGQNGFNQAINDSKRFIDESGLLAESEILTKFFQEIEKKDGKYSFGKKQVLNALEAGAAELLIVWNESVDVYSSESKDAVPLLDWLLENAHKFGAKLSFVSDKTSLGNQFVKGFGGLGAMLRYQIYEEQEDVENLENDDDLFI